MQGLKVTIAPEDEVADVSVQLLKLYYDAFNRGDTAGMLDIIADDIMHEPSQGAVRNGKAALPSSSTI